LCRALIAESRAPGSSATFTPVDVVRLCVPAAPLRGCIICNVHLSRRRPPLRSGCPSAWLDHLRRSSQSTSSAVAFRLCVVGSPATFTPVPPAAPIATMSKEPRMPLKFRLKKRKIEDETVWQRISVRLFVLLTPLFITNYTALSIVIGLCCSTCAYAKVRPIPSKLVESALC
jgi:hypothetical protein